MNAPQWVISTVMTDAGIKADSVNLPALKRDVRRAVAIAKLAEFENQAFRLGRIVATGYLEAAAAADFLSEVAFCNGLPEAHGVDVVQAIIARGVAWCSDAPSMLEGSE